MAQGFRFYRRNNCKTWHYGGVINPETVIENEKGLTTRAKSLVWLKFPQPTPMSVPMPMDAPAKSKGLVWKALLFIGLLLLLGWNGWETKNVITEVVNLLPQLHENGDPPDPPQENPWVNGGGNPRPPTDNKYVMGGDFSDGVAWVAKTRDDWHCIDKTGKIVLSLNPGERPVSNFSHGVALVLRSSAIGTGGGIRAIDNRNRVIELIDKSGKVISSPKSGEYDRITHFIHDIGMILVHKHIDTFQLTENRAGVIDSSGKWRVPLTNDQFWVGLTRTNGSTPVLGGEYLHDYTGGVVEYRGIINRKTPFSYVGNGLFENRNPSTGDVRVYNLSTGGVRVYWSQTPTDSRSPTRGSVFVQDQSGTAKAIINFTGQTSFARFAVDIGHYTDGLFSLQVRSDSQVIVPPGFYDISGRRIIDLTKYDIRSNLSNLVFRDGYCVLNIRNPQRAGYYTVIDKSGREMFAPKRSPRDIDGDVNLSTQGGMIVIREFGRGATILNAVTGDVVAEFRFGSVSDYAEDVAVVRDRDHDGIYYIDKTGKRLF